MFMDNVERPKPVNSSVNRKGSYFDVRLFPSQRCVEIFPKSSTLTLEEREEFLERRELGLRTLFDITRREGDFSLKIPRIMSKDRKPGEPLQVEMAQGVSLDPSLWPSPLEQQQYYLSISTQAKVQAAITYARAIQEANNVGVMVKDHKSDSVFLESGVLNGSGIAVWIVDPGLVEQPGNVINLDMDHIRSVKAEEVGTGTNFGRLLLNLFNARSKAFSQGPQTIDLRNAVPASIRKLATSLTEGKIGSIDDVVTTLSQINPSEIDQADIIRQSALAKLTRSEITTKESTIKPVAVEVVEEPVQETDKSLARAELEKFLSGDYESPGKLATKLTGTMWKLVYLMGTNYDIYEVLSHDQLNRLDNFLATHFTELTKGQLLKEGWKPPEQQ